MISPSDTATPATTGHRSQAKIEGEKRSRVSLRAGQHVRVVGIDSFPVGDAERLGSVDRNRAHRDLLILAQGRSGLTYRKSVLPDVDHQGISDLPRKRARRDKLGPLTGVAYSRGGLFPKNDGKDGGRVDDLFAHGPSGENCNAVLAHRAGHVAGAVPRLRARKEHTDGRRLVLVLDGPVAKRDTTNYHFVNFSTF
jgi:hypothetical protein